MILKVAVTNCPPTEAPGSSVDEKVYDSNFVFLAGQ